MICSKDELRVLAWLPADTRPEEWVTPPALAGFLAETFGHRFTERATTSRLLDLKRKGLVVRRRDVEPGADGWRRTPSGSQVLLREGSRVA